MTNTDTLLDAIVTSLQAIPDLVTLLGDADHIRAHKHQWPSSVSWMLALRDLKPLPSILVHYRGTRTSRWGNIPSRQHDFSLLMRDGENVAIADIWEAIMNGEPTGYGSLRWTVCVIHADVDMIAVPDLEVRTMQVTDTAWLDYHEATFGLTEKYST